MGIKERKEREKDAHRELIISAAEDIIEEEGIENLSIRGIANSIEYSSGIIYHYFKDKEEIINIVMRKKYQEIISTVTLEQFTGYNPEARFRFMLRKYIDMALTKPEAYKSILLNSSAEVLEHTSVLFEGAAEKRQALGMMQEAIKAIQTEIGKEDKEIELTTQIVWTATFGLIIRLIIEKDTAAIRMEQLIEQHINFMLHGIKQLAISS